MMLRDLANSRPARLTFWAAGLFAFVMAILPHPPELAVEQGDKVQHIIAFATLAALGCLAYSATPLVKLLVRLSLFGAAIEVIQAVPALHRDADALDWLADTLAVMVVLLVVRALWGRSST